MKPEPEANKIETATPVGSGRLVRRLVEAAKDYREMEIISFRSERSDDTEHIKWWNRDQVSRAHSRMVMIIDKLPPNVES